MKGNIVEKFMSNLGLNQGIASQIASSLKLVFMGKLVHKTYASSNSSFQLSGILGSLTCGGFEGNV